MTMASISVKSQESDTFSYGDVQLLRNALGGRGVSHGVTLCDGERGSAERYVTPRIIYMYN